MDERTKASIRKQAHIYYWVAQAVLVLAFVTALAEGLFQGFAGKYFGTLTLIRTDRAVVSAWTRFQDERLRDLAKLRIPADANAQSEWAHDIRDRLDQPVAVFIKDDDAIHWLMVPEAFMPITAGAPGLFDANVKGDELGHTDTLGTVLFRRAYLGKDSLGASVQVFGRINDSQCWGILYKWSDVWRPFLASLARAKLGTQLEAAGRLLDDEVQIAPPLATETEKTGMRAEIDGELLLSTPGLVTTRQSFTSGIKDVRLEYYLSDRDQAFANMISGKKSPWVIVFVIAALMLAVHRFYGWIKGLTAAEV